ncbi:MAG: heavy metal-associated domain-containing protein [Vicingaceae bacterium]
MKKSLKNFLLIGLVGLISFSCQNPEETAAKVDTETESTKTVLAENKASVDMKVEGMVCAMGCAKFIEEKVSKLDGVVLSEVNFEEESAHFEFDKTNTSALEIEKFINDIHDGQYSAKIATKTAPESKEVKTTESDDKKSVGAVSESLNFSFPELFTYFLKRI